MSHHWSNCPVCGSPKSSWLDDNCPVCLMRLGAAAVGEPPLSVLPSTAKGRQLGDYELLAEIARGGMGVVYRARQKSLNRLVAVKILLGGPFADETFTKRFRREAEAAASLNHPNIVAIHEVGEQDGHLYFSMDLIEGQNLSQKIQGNPLPVRQTAQLLKTVAEAVAFAHGRRLLHRDLKPSNVLVDAMGVPHITDFGLAKHADGDHELTLTGQILGSPNYMAPEQADPNLAPTTAASDIYSLGAMLYHCLTGRPPYLAETVPQTLKLASEGEPVPPRLLHPGVPRDLETICLKCLQRYPTLRYAAAQEVADELGRFLKDEPIRARPVGLPAKLARWCRRKPALATALGGVIALLLFVAIGSPIALLRIQGERERSEAALRKEAASRSRAETAEHQARRQLYIALVEQAHSSVRSGEIGQRLRALEAIRRAASISNSVELRQEAVAALALPDLRFERELPLGREYTLQCLDPTFESVALCRGSGPVEIRATSDWRLLATLPASTNLPAYVGCWSADRRYFAVKRDYSPGGARADLEIWEMPTQKRILTLHHMVSDAMAFHPLQHRLIASLKHEGVAIWDLEEGRITARLPLAGSPSHIAFAPDGERFAAVTELDHNAIVSVHDTATGRLLASNTFADVVMAVDWHPRGRWIAIADYRGMVQLMDPQSAQTHLLGVHKAQAATVAFSPDGNYLFSGGWERELICWDICTLRRAFTIGQSWTAQIHSDGHKLAVFSPSGIQLHTFIRPNPREFPEDLGPRLRRAAFSPDGRWLAAVADQHLGLWDLTVAAPGTLAKGGDDLRPTFTTDGNELLIGGEEDSCLRWRVLPGTNSAAPPRIQTLEPPTLEKHTAVCTGGKKLVFTSSHGSGVVDWDDSRATEFHWVPTAQGLNGVSPDGRWLGVYPSFSPLLYIYRLPEIEPVATLRSLGNISEFAFSPFCHELAVSTRAGVEFWNTTNWTRTCVLTNFTGILFGAEASSWWLRTDFRTAGLYDASTRAPLFILPAGTLPLAVSADGRHLAVSVDMRHLQVWDLHEVRSQLRELGLPW